MNPMASLARRCILGGMWEGCKVEVVGTRPSQSRNGTHSWNVVQD